MSQHDGNLANQAGSLFRADLNDLAGALLTKNSGASAPGTMYGNMWWVDTTSGTLKRRNNGNTAWVPVATIDATIVVSRSSNTILDISDIGKTIVATASFTQTLDAAATLGDGWWIGYRIESAVVTTFDPNASETIDGSTTKVFTGPDGGFIVCNGSAFFTLSFAAIPDGSVTEVKLASNAVTQVKMADAAVGQAELKTATGNVSTLSTSGVLLTLPGGAYGFYPQLAQGAPGDTSYWGWDFTNSLGKQAGSVTGTTFTASIYLATSNPGDSAIASQRYIQASPPYNLGDGDVPLFVFAIVDNGTGAVLSTYVAPEPPWANNGPTIIRPQFEDKQGRGFRRRRVMPFPWAQAKDAPAKRAQFIAALANPQTEVYEITQAVKQADMPLIPHPFQGNDMTGKTVVLIDPVSQMCERLLRLHEEFDSTGESVGALFHGDYLRVSNTPLNRAKPPGVIAVAANWKLT
jgi:hypothetical protein